MCLMFPESFIQKFQVEDNPDPTYSEHPLYCIVVLSIRILHSTFKEFNIGTHRFEVILMQINLCTTLVSVLMHTHSNVRIVLIIVLLSEVLIQIQ